MRKILLILEDYNEMLFLETLLKKVGFDALSIRNEVSLSEKMMGFSPDLVIATGDGHKINGVRVAKKVKKNSASTKLLLLFPRSKLQADNALDGFHADGALETPLNPRSILMSVCSLTNLNLDGIMAKFEKLPIARDSAAHGDELQIISGKKPIRVPGHASESESQGKSRDRINQYGKFLVNLPETNQNAFPRKVVQEETEDIRKFAKENPTVRAIDELRMAFVKALFKK